MRLEIVKIGNSRGIRIPKPVLETCAIGNAVELEIIDGKMVLTAAKALRAGWEAAYLADPPRHGEDDPAASDIVENDFDTDEWQW